MAGVAFAGLVLAPLPAFAAATSAEPAKPAVPAAAVGPDGQTTLIAPDAASALAIARLQKQAVEIVGERTEVSSTWALPDGTRQTGTAAGPLWVRRGGDGTQVADWAAVDPTLVAAADGSVSARALPAAVALSGAKAAADGTPLVTLGGADRSARLVWQGALPTPSLQGPRAVYAEVRPGVDLVVDATRTGFEQFFVVKQRPAAGAALDLPLSVEVTGAVARSTAAGEAEFVGADGGVVGAVPAPLVWDATLDQERTHPVTQPYVAAAGESVALAPRPGSELAKAQPDRSVTVRQTPPRTSTVVPLPAGADRSVPAGLLGRLGSAALHAGKATPSLRLPARLGVRAGSVAMQLAPDPAYLQDPDVHYPLVIDPETRFERGFDTWVQTGYGSDQSGSTELRVGTPDGGATVARSFLNYDLRPFAGKVILSSTLDLYEFHSFSCSPRNFELWAANPASTATRINAQPTIFGRWTVTNTTKGLQRGAARRAGRTSTPRTSSTCTPTPDRTRSR